MLQGRLPQEEICPVPEHVLGQLYRSSPHGLDDLVAGVPARTRAMLALYCYQRRHLRDLGISVASRCDEFDLQDVGGFAGGVLFRQSRQAPARTATPSHFQGRQRVTLSTGVIKVFIQDEELDD